MNFLLLFAQITDLDIVGSERWTGGGSIGLVLVSLLLFVGLGVGAWYLNSRGSLRRRNTAQKLEVLETRALGGRQFLIVASYSGKVFLLSVCPGRVEYLCSLPSEGDSHDSSSGFGEVDMHGESFDKLVTNLIDNPSNKAR